MIALFIAMTIIVPAAGQETLDDVLNDFIIRLEHVRATGIHRIVDGLSGMMVVPSIATDASSDLVIIRRSKQRGVLEYRKSGKISPDRLRTVLRSGTDRRIVEGRLLLVDGTSPRITLRVVAPGDLGAEFSNFVKNSLRARLIDSGLYRVWESVDESSMLPPGEAFISAGLPTIRTGLRRDKVNAFLNLVLLPGDDKLVLFCQIISPDPADDEIFSLMTSMTPEIALLLQRDDSGRTPDSANEPVFVALLPSGALDIAAISLDDKAGDEFAVLTEKEILIYRLGSAGLERYLTISLDQIGDSKYSSRIITGGLTTADLDEDGSPELLVSCNRWAHGAVIRFLPELKVTGIAGQPLSSLRHQNKTLILTAKFLPGEDTYGDLLRFLDESGATYRLLSLRGVRSVLKLDAKGERFAVLDPLRHIRFWDRATGELRADDVVIQSVKAAAVFTSGSGTSLIYAVPRSKTGSAARPFGDTLIARKAGTSDGEISSVLPTSLDIISIAVYYRSTSRRAIAVMGRSVRGEMRLELYNWPYK